MGNLGPDIKVQPLSQLIGREVEIEGVSGSSIPYEGYVELPFNVNGNDIKVPFLVTKENIQNPIIGFNVISLLSSNGENKNKISTMKALLSDDLDEASIVALIEVIETANDVQSLSSVNIPREGVLLKAGEMKNMRCKIQAVNLEQKTPVLFEPELQDLLPDGIMLQSNLLKLKKGLNTNINVVVTNASNHEIFVPGRSCIGDIQLIKSVTPADVQLKVNENKNEQPPRFQLGHSGVNGSAAVNGEVASGDVTLNTESGASYTCTNVNLKEAKEHDEKYKEMINSLDLSMLSKDERDQACKLFWKEREVFAVSVDEIGCAEDLVMNLKTTDETPVQKNYNSIPRPLISEVKNHVEDLLNRKWIAKSQSSWSSPVVIVHKKNGEIRLCCDFRALNKKTIQDTHPLPRVQETLDSLGGSHWFTVLDQSRAYYQGFMSEEDRHKTAFVSPWGLYEWVRIPFGLTNAPAKFQRYMEETVADFRDKFALPYLDDVIVYSKTFEGHLSHIGQVLQRLKERGLRLNIAKCKFFQSRVKFLGRVVTKAGYHMDDDSIAAVQALKNVKPRNISDIRHVLGLLGYHRRNIQDFSRRAKPLTNLLLTKGREKQPGVKQSEKKMEIVWTEECQTTLESLIDAVTSAPIMAYPDFNKEFILHTDASTLGLGCILYQKQEGKMRVIGYGSRTLNKAESNYHPSKLEFLALKWAITEFFCEYLGYANHFFVFTDNNPLVYLMETRKLTAYSARWISELAEFNFSVKYRPGKVNTDPDCLSRLPLNINSYIEECTEEVGQDAFRAIMAGTEVRYNQQEAWRVAINAINVDFIQTADTSTEMIKDNIRNIKKEQENDENIFAIIELIKNKSKCKIKQTDNSELKILKRGIRKLKLSDDGILLRKNKENNQIVLPKKMRNMIYQKLHIDMGHLGTEKVLALARKRVYWPNMEKDITNFINGSCLCLMQRRPHTTRKAELQSIITTLPMELVAVDFVKLEKGSGGYQYILVIIDHFTRFAQAYPTKNKSAKTAAQRLYQDFLLRYGIPAKLMSDQGGEFQNQIINELNDIIGITKARTTPYHPQSNGACERMNKTLLKMLRSLPENAKGQWPQHLNHLIHAYNCMPHSGTGYSPFFLMYGREPKLPIDLLLAINEDNVTETDYKQYVNEWVKGMKEAYHIAHANSLKRKETDKKRWNAKSLLSTLQVGDRVLVMNKKQKVGPSKLVSHWEPVVYIVHKVVDQNNVVFELKREDGQGRHWVLHRNMLLPVCDEFRLVDTNSQPKQQSASRAKSKSAINIISTSEDEAITLTDEGGDEFPQYSPSGLHAQQGNDSTQSNVQPHSDHVEDDNMDEEFTLAEELVLEENNSEDSSSSESHHGIDNTVNEVISEAHTSITEDSRLCTQQEEITPSHTVNCEIAESNIQSHGNHVEDENELDEFMFEESGSSDSSSSESEHCLEYTISEEHGSDTDEQTLETDKGESCVEGNNETRTLADKSITRNCEYLQNDIQLDPNITPVRKSRRQRVETRIEEWKGKRDEVRRANRPHFDTLSKESLVKIQSQGSSNIEIMNEHSSGTQDSTNDENINEAVDNVVTRDVRDVDDDEEQKGEEQPEDDTVASLHEIEQSRVEIDELPNDTVMHGYEENRNIGRRSDRIRRSPSRLTYDVFGKPKINEVSVCDDDIQLISEIQSHIGKFYELLQTLWPRQCSGKLETYVSVSDLDIQIISDIQSQIGKLYELLLTL